MNDTSQIRELLERADSGHFRLIEIKRYQIAYMQRVPLYDRRTEELPEDAFFVILAALQKFFVVDRDRTVDLEIGQSDADRPKLAGHIIEGYLALDDLTVAAEQHFDNYGVEQWLIHPGFARIADVNAYNDRRGNIVHEWYAVVTDTSTPRARCARQSLLYTLANEVDLSTFDVRLFAQSLGVSVRGT